ncbi:MAG TPA: homoserine dehydrogenase [Thermodesulfobacteriota bacterium]|nr:homoserine dehydrogenase [Thermodesulfobacteriota bacterium]
MSVVNVGLIGAGTVGCGVIKILEQNKEIIEKRTGITPDLRKIADIDPDRKRPVRIPRGKITRDAGELINDPSIDIIIELIGGTTIAKDLVLAALRNKKHVVTANKALLAHHGKEIFAAAAENGVEVGFEASVGGGIPIIKSTLESFAANNILSIHGIINGTSNYILSRMTDEGSEFEAVLAEAQKEGYAEADPSFDVDGIDAAHKLSILIMLAFGRFIDFGKIHVEGIRNITPVDISFADELGYKIKLLAIAKASGEGLEAGVYPALVKKGTQLADVSGAFNAIYIVGDALGPAMLYGKGAGMMPTASAVVSDVLQIGKHLSLGNEHLSPPRFYAEKSSLPLIKMSDTVNKYYIRFQAEDRPGVLGKITGGLGSNGISIESVIQKGRHHGGGDVPVVIMTHEAREKDLLKALRQIGRLSSIRPGTMFLRIEDL